MTDIALSLDCLGMKCPRPIIELNTRIGEVEIGQLIELRADDPAAGPDLAAWCRMTGQELVITDPPRFVIRKSTKDPNR
jgi:tRNA 2-thiouridine synthesizing protein A